MHILYSYSDCNTSTVDDKHHTCAKLSITWFDLSGYFWRSDISEMLASQIHSCNRMLLLLVFYLQYTLRRIWENVIYFKSYNLTVFAWKTPHLLSWEIRDNLGNIKDKNHLFLLLPSIFMVITLFYLFSHVGMIYF